MKTIRRCTYQHPAWSKPCGKFESDPVHYRLDPPYGYSGPVRHPFNASQRWSPWFGEGLDGFTVEVEE